MLRHPASEAIDRAIALVLKRFDEPLTLADLAKAAGMSRFGFCRHFRRQLGMPPLRWLWSFRAVLAAELIDLVPSWTLTEVWTLAGFSSSAHFSRSFKGVYRVAPSVYRRSRLRAEPGFRPGGDELERLLDAATRRALAATQSPVETLGLGALAASDETP